MPEPRTNLQTTNLAELLERILDKGVVIVGDIKINLLDVELLTIKIRLLVTERLRRYGFDEDTVVAQAMAMRSAELARISEMRTRAEAQANAHLREIERHRDAIGRPSMALLNAPADAGAEGRDARASA